MAKALITLSGGPDSASLAYVLHKEPGIEKKFCFINYGHPARYQELAAAQRIANDLESELLVIEMQGLYDSFVSKGIDAGALRMAGSTNPHMPMMAASTLAAALEIERFIVAVHQGDLEIYPGTVDVLRLQEQLIRRVERPGFAGLTYELPFLKLTKDQVFARGHEAGAPLHITWSCYEIGSPGLHCGSCNGCHRRRNAFKTAGIPDRTRYAEG